MIYQYCSLTPDERRTTLIITPAIPQIIPITIAAIAHCFAVVALLLASKYLPQSLAFLLEMLFASETKPKHKQKKIETTLKI